MSGCWVSCMDYSATCGDVFLGWMGVWLLKWTRFQRNDNMWGERGGLFIK